MEFCRNMNELEQLIYDNPNNMKLGELIREKYTYRETQEFIPGTVYPSSLSTTLLEFGATDNNSKSKRVTTVETHHIFPEIQLELNLHKNNE
jgi:hypothetical protein